MGHLQDENLLPTISILLKTAGLVEEEENGLLLFLMFLTRDFDQPLNVLIQGSTESGKTNLLQTVFSCIPHENRYLAKTLSESEFLNPPYPNFWRNKILLLDDLDFSVSDLDAIRKCISGGKISKDTIEFYDSNGEYKQKADIDPVCIVGTISQDKLVKEFSSNFFIINMDETDEQQQKVIDYQNKIEAGLIDQEGVNAVREVLKNMQRSFNRKLEIRNPFLKPVFKRYRVNVRYIMLVKAITYLHQHQLEIKQDKTGIRYVETNLNHIEWANKLFK